MLQSRGEILLIVHVTWSYIVPWQLAKLGIPWANRQPPLGFRLCDNSRILRNRGYKKSSSYANLGSMRF